MVGETASWVAGRAAGIAAPRTFQGGLSYLFIFLTFATLVFW